MEELVAAAPNTIWRKQNVNKNSEWARLAKQGNSVFHLMTRDGFKYLGRVRINGAEYTYENARKQFFSQA